MLLTMALTIALTCLGRSKQTLPPTPNSHPEPCAHQPTSVLLPSPCHLVSWWIMKSFKVTLMLDWHGQRLQSFLRMWKKNSVDSITTLKWWQCSISPPQVTEIRVIGLICMICPWKSLKASQGHHGDCAGGVCYSGWHAGSFKSLVGFPNPLAIETWWVILWTRFLYSILFSLHILSFTLSTFILFLLWLTLFMNKLSASFGVFSWLWGRTSGKKREKQRKHESAFVVFL